MRLVIVESPYAGKSEEERERNVRYAQAAMRDCLKRGEAPLASHLLYAYSGVLDDEVEIDRELGIDAGLAWGLKADATVIYEDLGVSPGMRRGILMAERALRPVLRRLVPHSQWRRDPVLSVPNRLRVVERTVLAYHKALDEGQDGGHAAHVAMARIQRSLGMPWYPLSWRHPVARRRQNEISAKNE